jgi:hypothetical protein
MTTIKLCTWPGHYWRLFYQSCTISREERQKAAIQKLENNEILLKYKVNELERKIADMESQKNLFVKQRKISEAKALVLEKHKLTQRVQKEKAVLQFTQSLLTKIEDQRTLKDTLSTLNDATHAFKTMEAPGMLDKFDRLADTFDVSVTNVTDATRMLNDRMMELSTTTSTGLLSPALEAEVEAEFKAIEDEIARELAATLPNAPSSGPHHPPASTSADEIAPSKSLTSSYLAAGFSLLT